MCLLILFVCGFPVVGCFVLLLVCSLLLLAGCGCSLFCLVYWLFLYLLVLLFVGLLI